MKTMTVDVSPLYGLFGAAIGAPVLWFPTVAALGITLLTQLIEHQSPNLLLPVTVQLEDFTFKRNGDLFHVTAKASCALNLGAVNLVNIRVTTQADYQLLLQEDGAFASRQHGTPFTSSPDVSAPEWLTKLGDIGTIVSILLGAVLTVVTEGTAAVVIGVAAALISGAINVAPELIAQGLASGTQVAIPAHIQAFVSKCRRPGELDRLVHLIQADIGGAACLSATWQGNCRPRRRLCHGRCAASAFRAAIVQRIEEKLERAIGLCPLDDFRPHHEQLAVANIDVGNGNGSGQLFLPHGPAAAQQ
jgi:hypothetical protein